jgi:IS1 family transposase
MVYPFWPILRPLCERERSIPLKPKIERKHLTFRTRLKRLARKMLCFSRSCVMHALLMGLYMNHVEFGFTT